MDIEIEARRLPAFPIHESVWNCPSPLQYASGVLLDLTDKGMPSMENNARGFTRRQFVQAGSAAWLMLQTGRSFGVENLDESAGLVVGQPQGAEAAAGILAEGGNAVDAA